MNASSTDLLFALWREAGRHVDAAESIPVLAGLLAGALPFRSLRLDERSPEHADLVTLAEWSKDQGIHRRNQPVGCAANTIAAIERWAARGELAEREPGQRWPPALSLLDAEPDGGAALAGGLLIGEDLVGLAIVRGERAFTAAEKMLFHAALEPLAAIIANDCRLREIRSLTARAEAERDSLLSRLGRASLTETIVGADAGLRQVIARVGQVARSDASVLILGETGSGKEVIARAIHEGSGRREGPFIRVNCGAVAPELIDSELFGHERGSFTGALAARRGWFERASGGTLFLDEIGELAPAVQVRLLRVLQDGVVQRLGGEQELAVDVRVVAATHRDLPQLVQDGRFREDLWYRIAVFPIILPPLRERPEDLPALATHFIQRAANRAGLHVPALDAPGIERLRAYPWPGNVRELAAVIERAVILGQGERLELGLAIGPALQLASMPAMAAAERGTVSTAAPAPLDEAIAEHIRRALAHCGGRVDGAQGAARLLGINASTLRSKMRKLGMLGKGGTPA